jgi:hypothetical protein
MTSILKVDTIQDQAGNNIINESSDTITIGASGDTLEIHKNGAKYRGTMNNMNANFITGLTPYVGTVIDMNGSTDYLEVYVRPAVSSGTVKSQGADNVFGAYRIGA